MHTIAESRQFTLVLFCLAFVFETELFLCVALAVLTQFVETRLSWNTEIHLSLPPKCGDQRQAPPRPTDKVYSSGFLFVTTECQEIAFNFLIDQKQSL